MPLFRSSGADKEILYPECPTPKTKEEYEDLVRSFFLQIQREEEDPSWKAFNYVDPGEKGLKGI